MRIQLFYVLNRYVLWECEDKAVRVLIPDVFSLIKKKSLSNNVGSFFAYYDAL